MRRILSLILCGMLMMSLLSGCGQSSTNAKNEGASDLESVTVDIFQNKSEVAQQLEAAAKTYMEANPGVVINIETVQGNDYNTALKAKMLVNDAVDIMALGANDIVNNYKDYLEDLSDQPWLANVSDGLLEDAKLEGKVVGLPVNIEGYGIAYNKAIFSAAGIDASKLTSYDAIDQAFSDLQQKIDSGALKAEFPQLESVFEYAAKESWVMGLHTLNIPMANELGSAKAALEADEIELKYSNEFKDLLTLLTQYTSSKEDLKLLLAVDYSTQIGGGLAIERVAAVQQGNWIGPEVKSISPEVYENLDFLPLPLKGVKEDSIAVGVPAYWCVNKNADEATKKAAKDFMNWLYQSDEGKSIVVNQLGYIPAFKNYDGVEITDPLSASIQRYVREGKTMPWVFGGFPSGYEGQSASDIQAYIGGETTWDECIQALKDDWKALKK
ncbi:ABC transporter substrate-binding protein [Fusibacter ferrireducens]|uniref:Carbohydrate ABC transporter substrate-binding protein n=1 Tax=Fusibacter ferrireducens TaxID=2785058 RepID=A0ABR9ZQ18_9FIRM|nr:ABC transporter substrate-binding protein [Fusibacter ferrireducens]MBF4692534.1 carbohydrate ABC transporter substrate-binding protein [Fusibacter ferrireducens]